jgi:hypothetical protein
MLCKAQSSVRAFWGPKTGKFPEIEDKLFTYFEKNTEYWKCCISRNAAVTSAR